MGIGTGYTNTTKSKYPLHCRDQTKECAEKEGLGDL